MGHHHNSSGGEAGVRVAVESAGPTGDRRGRAGDWKERHGSAVCVCVRKSLGGAGRALRRRERAGLSASPPPRGGRGSGTYVAR